MPLDLLAVIPSYAMSLQGNGAWVVQAGAAFDGFWLGVAVMVLLLASLVYSVVRVVLPVGAPAAVPRWRSGLIPLLAVLGMGIAAYMSFIETQNVAAFCGPVGDCNEVQSSVYAKLFGVPVAIFGLLGYAGIAASWVLWQFRSDRLHQLAAVVMFGMAFFGVLFSIYLTYLELAIIRAVCAWCLSSALVMAALLALSAQGAVAAMSSVEDFA